MTEFQVSDCAVELESGCGGIRVGDVLVGADVLVRSVMPCNATTCDAYCCRMGALVAPELAQRISDAMPRILPLLRPEARRVVQRRGWAFKNMIRECYTDPDKMLHASRVADGFCVFLLDRHDGRCALHRLALEEGQPVTYYKPLECFLFPLTEVTRGAIHIHTWKGYPCTQDDPGQVAAFDLLEEELTLLLGRECYTALTREVERLAPKGLVLEPEPFVDPEPRPRGRPRKTAER